MGCESSERPVIPYGHQSIDDEDVESVVSVLRSSYLTTGPMVDAFESAFSTVTAAEHAIAVCNGTAALHAAVYAIGVGAGDEVIVPNRTWIATAHAPMMLGAKVILVDVLPDRPVMDTSQVRKKINSRTKAIMPASLCGCAVEMEEVWQIALDYNLFVV